MKEEFLQYLNNIGLTETDISRVENIYEMYKDLFPETIEDIFVEDYIDSEGIKVYTSISFLSEKYIGDVTNFITSDDSLFIAPLKNNLVNLVIKKNDYNYVTFTNNSRLSVNANLSDSTGYSLKCTGENCNYLRDIVKKYLLPNLRF